MNQAQATIPGTAAHGYEQAVENFITLFNKQVRLSHEYLGFIRRNNLPESDAVELSIWLADQDIPNKPQIQSWLRAFVNIWERLEDQTTEAGRVLKALTAAVSM